MTDLIQNGLNWLAAQLNVSASQSITYTQGIVSYALLATIGKTDVVDTDDDGNALEFRMTDFLFDAADFPVVPAPGDTIHATPAGVAITYEVLPFPNGEYYRNEDPYGVRIRIHTKIQSSL